MDALLETSPGKPDDEYLGFCVGRYVVAKGVEGAQRKASAMIRRQWHSEGRAPAIARIAFIETEIASPLALLWRKTGRVFYNSN